MPGKSLFSAPPIEKWEKITMTRNPKDDKKGRAGEKIQLGSN